MNKVQEFFKALSGSELPAVKVGVDPNTFINLAIAVVGSGALLMILYFLLFHKKS